MREYILTKPKNNIYDQFWAQNHADGFGAADYPLGFAAATVNASPDPDIQGHRQGRCEGRRGAPLLGVTVIVKGTSVGTSTSIDGEYQIQCAADAELDFSFIGYETQTLPVANRTLLNVTLKEDAQLMDEVIVIGYGTTTRRRAVGAVDQIKSKPSPNVPSPT
ncbi:MAG: carboxypeptidase-like regulatory domain-containing protein [Alistipes finegoldii]